MEAGCLGSFMLMIYMRADSKILVLEMTSEFLTSR